MAYPEAPDERVESSTAIRLLALPIRMELVDTIEALGGAAAVAELAEQLGKPADGLYYHLRLLADAGLLLEQADRGDGQGRRYATPTRSGQRLQLRYRPDQLEQAQALEQLVGGLLGIARADFGRALATPGVSVEGPRRELWASRTKGWVNAAELEEINTLLARLGTLLKQPRSPGRDRLLALAWVLAPIAPQPRRRGARRQRPPQDAPAG